MSADTERFTSRFKRENRTERPSGGVGAVASRLRRYETGTDSNETTTNSTRPSSGVSVSIGSRFNRDKPESTTKTDSIVPRMNRLNLNDKKEPENTSDKEDDKDDDDDDQSKKSSKKSSSNVNKRKNRRNMREKRRSTGVVIMPGQPTVATDDEERKVMENTARNMDTVDQDFAGSDVSTSSGNFESSDEREQLLKKIEEYELIIEEWKDELAKAKKENESLAKENQRLKEDNSALLRVVSSMSGSGRKH